MLSPRLAWVLANPLWAQALNPLITNPLNSVQILQNVNLINGVTYVLHGLGKLQQGWFLVDLQGSAIIYRSAPFTTSVLTLTSNAAVTCSIGVF
jgi:hypothetical protein